MREAPTSIKEANPQGVGIADHRGTEGDGTLALSIIAGICLSAPMKALVRLPVNASPTRVKISVGRPRS